MNERIFELIQTQNGFRGLLWTEEDKQEFAELIVRECAKEAFEFWCYQVDCSEESAQSHIKKHFGVE